ncbi:unnamed protein product [Rhizoctonia solani]|uniref:Major facilitator superfamily (MFS) profile domain-containing protein n=1 Tax=Rhizoctonia solani TaxID=456999 RepID=A0A8H2XRV1_9AGAM|nr:unnamed protein product [Rhizoctonia solani]
MSDIDSKHAVEQHEHSSGQVNKHPDAEFGGTIARRALEKRLLRKLDLRMSILIFIYILNYIDRNNAAAARLRGFEKDLGLTRQEFPTLLSILYVGYILMQIPSNIFLNYIGKPSLYLPVCMLIWGMISVLTGITHNFIGALLTRFFLGFVEAAFFPGALFLLSKWYKRDELGLRTAILYCGNLSSNAFGSLLAAGILDGMQGKLGHAAWRWLFYIEGALTMGVAVLAIFILPDFPSTTSWLSPEEKRLAEVRMAEDVGGEVDKDSSEEGHLYGFFLAMRDWKVWWLAVALTGITIGLSFNAYFPKRAVALAFINAFSQLGNVAGSYVWPKSWEPTYRKSYVICIACFALAIAMALFLRQHLANLNKRLDRGETVEGICDRTEAIEQAADLEGVPIEELRSRRKAFRFVY